MGRESVTGCVLAPLYHSLAPPSHRVTYGPRAGGWVCSDSTISQSGPSLPQGDIWAESRWLGVFWRYYACMDGSVFDISEWAACQSQSLKHLQANHHTVQYRIISGAKRHRQPADEPS